MDPVGGDYGFTPDGGGPHPGVFIIHLIILLLLIAIGVAIGFVLARRGERPNRALSRQAIYDEVRKKIDQALKAQGADLINAAQVVVDAVRSRLGPVSELTKTVGDPVDAIAKALTGKITDPVKPPAPPQQVPIREQGATVVINPPSIITTVNVIEPPPDKKPPEPPPAPAKPVERDMSLREQLTALRLAVEAFSAVWERNRMDTLLKAAQSALLDARPAPGSGLPHDH